MKNQLNFEKIKSGFLSLSSKSESEKNKALENIAKLISARKKEIAKANIEDVKNAKKNGKSQPFIERLILDKQGVDKLVLKIREIRKLESGLGSAIEDKEINGMRIKKISVPLGVILVIYEARPEVTIDVAALCIKSGNAAILKGGSDAFNTNEVLYKCIAEALEKSGFSKEIITLVSSRQEVSRLLERNDYIDLVIARGGYQLVKDVVSKSRIPVLAHCAGGARIYVDKSADLDMAKKIIINAKINKPAACNSLDTIVVHKDVVLKFIPEIVKELRVKNVQIIGDDFVSKLGIDKASENDWHIEFLTLKIGIKVVGDVKEAVNFINKYTKKHSEGIIALDKKVIQYFLNSLDCAALFVNCSPRLHDGYVFGLGSEMGIATGKLHARGPVGLRELTTYRWEVFGNGQIRE